MLYPETNGVRRSGELIDIILVRTFGPDALPPRKGNGRFPDTYNLFTPAHQVHFDSTFPGVVEGIMPKGIELEITLKFTVYPLQQIQVKSSRYSLTIIVCPV